ncbi:ABC transporter ATP-binding protein [Paenibacillus xanthanilyticus]|uniref:ABC transporter ATP-binding protein n=1 Tax=Paenibacillus xanthanilyticus TaxID=1783531 RepID=A0ABV8K3C8_9BACL
MSEQQRGGAPGPGGPSGAGKPGQGGMGPGSFGFGPGRGGPAGMGMPVQKAKNFKETLRRLIGYLKPYRGKLLVVFVTAVLSTVFSILGPKIMGEATTELFAGLMGKSAVDYGYIADILLVLAVLYVISALFGYIQQYVMAGVAQRTVASLRKDVNEKLERLPLKFYDSRTHGEILSRAVNDVDNISSTLQQSLTQFITSIVTLVGVVVMMLTISPLLTLITIVTLPLSFIAIKAIAGRSQTYFKDQQASLGELNGHVEEMYTGHPVVKAFGYERKSVAIFDGVNERLYQSGWRAQFVSGMIMPIMGVIGNIGYVLVSVAGGLLVLHQRITIGDVQAFISYSRQFAQPITQTAQIANIIQSTIASAERVFELLDETEEVPEIANAIAVAASPKAGTSSASQGNVRFEHVKFGYKEDAPLIADMNIDVRSGQTIAIVGPTGAGKTTLINLLMRFYELNGGRITIDGTDITKLARGDLRSLFGMVLQDTWLFNGTIRDNIAYGRAGATEEDVVRAARAAHADHFIRTLPEGYDTVLNEEASNISQGQKQLLTIARAILADPAILILDEATSSVDTRTEAHIQRAMNTLMEGRTSFVIAHRLSTIREADLILVMNKGSVIEQGTHVELLAQGGFYADLYQSQFSGRPQAAIDAV